MNQCNLTIIFFFFFSFIGVKVIDDEKKTQELEAKKAGMDGAKGPLVDAPYPEGVKKHKIRAPEAPKEKAESEEGELETGNGKKNVFYLMTILKQFCDRSRSSLLSPGSSCSKQLMALCNV